MCGILIHFLCGTIPLWTSWFLSQYFFFANRYLLQSLFLDELVDVVIKLHPQVNNDVHVSHYKIK